MGSRGLTHPDRIDQVAAAAAAATSASQHTGWDGRWAVEAEAEEEEDSDDDPDWWVMHPALSKRSVDAMGAVTGGTGKQRSIACPQSVQTSESRF